MTTDRPDAPSVWLAAEGLDVEAFDASPVGVAKARRLAAERGVTVRFHVADADGWEWPQEYYDVVVAIYIQFAPPAMRRRIFERVARALRPGGSSCWRGTGSSSSATAPGGPRVPDQLVSRLKA